MSKERDLSPGQLARIAGRHADSLRAAGVEWIGAAAPPSAGARPAAASPPCVRLPLAAQQCVRLMTEGGQLLGIAEPAEAPGLLHPSVVLV